MKSKPKIIAIDADDIGAKLKTAGYNAAAGTWGRPYHSDDAKAGLVLSHDLPNYAEREIIFCDLKAPAPLAAPPSGGRRTSVTLAGRLHDPRPLVMQQWREESTRILLHGGVFVLFAAPHEELLYQIDRTTKISCSNWGVLDALRLGLTITEDHGEEVAVLAETPLTTSLARFLAGSTYECRLAAARSWDYAWKPLVVNKYKQAVAMVLSPSSDRKGWVIVLPRMRDRADLSLFLLDDVFPNLSPSLFPSLANASWLTSPPYEDPDVLRMREEIQIVERDARQKQEAIEAGIAKQREHRGFLHTLLTGTGNELVVAVHRTLELLGFSRVVDVDAASDADLREDLQVEGLAGLLLIEVKGVNGTGSDDDALAVLKYVAPRMRELKRTDVHALTILNHQRAQPALERMPNPFRDVVVQTAQQNHCGLMTTWTLFRLARNFERLGWQHGHVAPLFTTEGVISPIPAHYRPIGKVEMRWRNALGVRLIERLERGERIATESGIDFFEQSADSLQLEGEPVEGGAVGELVGVATKWTPKMCSDGATIFKVTTLA